MQGRLTELAPVDILSAGFIFGIFNPFEAFCSASHFVKIIMV